MVSEILKNMADDGRIISGNFDGNEYDIVIMELDNNFLNCWEENVGDFAVPIENFNKCSSTYYVELEIWDSFIDKLKEVLE